jgi:hypothetical protein
MVSKLSFTIAGMQCSGPVAPPLGRLPSLPRISMVGRFCGPTRQPVAAPPSLTTWCYNPREIMVDIRKVVAHWRTGAREDREVASDLVRLASAASLALDDHRRDVLAKMNAYALAGRSPDALPATVTPTDARDRLASAREVFEWLMTQLPG